MTDDGTMYVVTDAGDAVACSAAGKVINRGPAP